MKGLVSLKITLPRKGLWWLITKANRLSFVRLSFPRKLWNYLILNLRGYEDDKQTKLKITISNNHNFSISTLFSKTYILTSFHTFFSYTYTLIPFPFIKQLHQFILPLLCSFSKRTEWGFTPRLWWLCLLYRLYGLWNCRTINLIICNYIKSDPSILLDWSKSFEACSSNSFWSCYK